LTAVLESLLSSGWFPVVFAGAWFGLSGILSILGGWHTLAQSYRAPGGFIPTAADRFRFKSIQLKAHPFAPVNYGSCVTVGITEQGLYLAALPIFRFMHPPLLIPWREILDWDEGGFLWIKWVEVDTRAGGPLIRLPWGIGDVARSQWRHVRSTVPAP
jgi:hypothetical protein